MDSRPFIFYGRSQLNAYKSQFERALSAWLQHWFNHSLTAPKLTVSQFEQQIDVSSSRDAVWHLIGMAGFPIYLYFDGLKMSELLPSMLDLQHARAASQFGGNMNEEIVQELLRDFVSRWRKPTTVLEMPAPCEWENVTLPSSLFERGSGALLLTLTLGFGKIAFVVPFMTIRQFIPVSNASLGKRPVLRIAEVLGKEKLQLSVAVDAAEKVPLSALSGLNVGDVILLNRNIREPFNLINENGIRVGGCHIGRRGENRAIHIAAPLVAGTMKGITSKS